MSAYSKFNAMLATQPVNHVVEVMLTKFSGQRLPEVMFNRLDPRLRQATPPDRMPKGIDPAGPFTWPLTKAQKRARAAKKRELAQKYDALRTEIQTHLNAWPQPSWPVLLASDWRSEHWELDVERTAEQHVQRMLDRRNQWWAKHREAQTPLNEVLTAHRKNFAWPARLPATQMLTDLLAHPDTMGACHKQAKQAVKAYLAQVKACRAVERQAEAEARSKRAKEREQRRKERAEAEAVEQARVAKENEQLLATGYLPDSDPRTWRRLAEVAELVGMSASTVRADLKKDRLRASGYTRGGYMTNPTSLHSRPDLRAWIANWRPTVDPALVELFTAGERVARNELRGAKRWREIEASGRLIDGFKVAPPPGWPSNIELRVADSAPKAQARVNASPLSTLEGLEEEVALLASAWTEAVSRRARQGCWTPATRSAVEAFLARRKGHFKLSWPGGVSPSISGARVAGLLSKQLDEFVRQHPDKVHTLKALKSVELANPLSWYPAARSHPRRWVLHLGPTNSGKTHQAMEAMMAAPTGLYLAPLRLMALEGFDRLMAAGKPCALVTGEERKGWRPGDASTFSMGPVANGDSEQADVNHTDLTHVSATVEAGFDDSRVFDVAVIDEAQMMFDRDRGWAWAQALAGVCAREVHVCAAPEAGPTLRSLAKQLGVEVEVVKHQRLTPLSELPQPVGLKQLERGDALVVFSRRQLMGYRSWLRAKGKSVAVIYGDLGPEVRRAEAERFRSGEADILVATDAIGMGLNLPIRRVIFADTEKFDGQQRRALRPSEWKQIAGRAGRFGLYDKGFYGRLSEAGRLSARDDGSELELRFRPSRSLVKALAAWLGWTSVADVARFWRLPQPMVESSVHWGEAGWLECLARTNLSLEDQYRYLGAPVDKNTLRPMSFWVQEHGRGNRVELPAVPAQVSPASTRKELAKLEELAALVRIYRWCALAFPGAYPDDASGAQARLSGAIAVSLSTMALENLCDSCGRNLPVGHPHANCDPCFQGRRYHGGYGEGWY